ncbi:MAG TPA: fibronectin type III domain-containing protein, partial [Bacteroidales bacterium]|nr:fibronectin type III domain-containing protein [Bacteroidales bacterium]
IGDTSDWSNKRTFCTSYAPVNVPFNFDFETESGFLFANTSGTGWYIGNAPGVNVTLNGVSGLYISADNGFTNSYTATPAVVWAYRDIYFTPSASNYVMTFEWKCQGEATNDYFHIYIGSPMTPDTSNTGLITLPVGATPLATFMNQKPTWQETSRTLPAADYSGQHKRLYICWRNDDVTVNQPPATIDNLKITSADFSECLSPVSLFVDNITSNSATAYWGGNAAGWGVTYSWQFEYKKAEDTTWTTQNVHNRTYTMTGLQPSTPYDTRVKAICIGGQESFYTPIVSFTTPATPCVTPTNLQVSNVTNNSALATWTAGGSEPSWQVEYKLASADNWIANTTNTPSFTITGLQSSTLYHVRVKAICTSEESTFTDHVTFLTGGNTTYTIVATAGPHGTITPSGVVTVYQSGSQTFIFTPDAGCRIDVVLVDNVPQVPVPETYTFENIQGNHTIHVDFAEGIAENDLSRYVTLYPNPTQSLIDLKLDIDYLGTTQCRIYDMYGKLMHIFSIEEEITTIDVTYFASGIYFIHLTTEQGQVSKRFVKQ